jgi:hypothetical protein
VANKFPYLLPFLRSPFSLLYRKTPIGDGQELGVAGVRCDPSVKWPSSPLTTLFDDLAFLSIMDDTEE